MKRYQVLLFTLVMTVMGALAQEQQQQQQQPASSGFGHRLVDNLGVGVNLGTTGIGIDVATKLTNWASLRMGVDYTPGIIVPMNFNVNCYTGETLTPTKFAKLQELMQEFTGFYVDDNIRMDCQARMVNFKFLVDFYPLRNKHWYVTAGFYWGSSYVAKSINARSEMSSLLAIAMYNRMYDYIANTDFMEEPLYKDYYLDPDVADALKERFERYGRVGVHMGDYKEGGLYMMEPDADGMVKAKAYVNSFKPYLGLGFKTTMGQHVDLNVDLGTMMWGGAPKLITHEGVDLVRDVENIPGKVGDYVEIARHLKAYPVLTASFIYRFSPSK
jgi:hypothetical protein